VKAFGVANSIAHSSRASCTRSLRACFDSFVVPFGRPPLMEVPCEYADSVVVSNAVGIVLHGLVGVLDAVGIGMRDKAEFNVD
jgi:hypothetical protein